MKKFHIVLFFVIRKLFCNNNQKHRARFERVSYPNQHPNTQNFLPCHEKKAQELCHSGECEKLNCCDDQIFPFLLNRNAAYWSCDEEKITSILL